MQWIKAFVAGFLATLVFHQGVIGLLYLAGIFPAPPFNLSPVPPLGVPAVLSLAFWGGVWGIPIWWLIRRLTGTTHYALAIAAGAIGPTLVAVLVVFPLKGLAVTTPIIMAGLIVNGTWGLGLAIFMRLMGARPHLARINRPRFR